MISATIYDRGNIPASEGTIENNRWTKWINANSPVDVKFVPIARAEAAQKVNVLFASGDAPDLIFEYDPNIKNPLYDQKQLMPLDDLIEKHSVEYKKFLQKFPAVKDAGLKSDGKLYEFGKLNEVMLQNVIIIRNDWLKKLNLPVPKTTDELLQTAIAFANNDPDGNNKKDTFGISLSSNVGGALTQLFGVAMDIDDSGQAFYPFERQKSFVDFQKSLYDGGIVDKDFLTDKNGAKAKQDFLNGKLGIYPAQGNTFSIWYELFVTNYATIKANAPGAELTIIPFPKSPNGQFMSGLVNPLQMTAVVNAAAKDPVSVIKYIDFLLTPMAGVTLSNGIEGEHYKKGVNGCPVVLDVQKQKTEVSYHAGVDYDMVYNKTEDGVCGFLASNFDPGKPEEKVALDLFKLSMNNLYSTNPSMYPAITHSEHLPTLPNDLKVALENINKQTSEIWTKAILGGSKYTTDQALGEAKAIWEREGGKRIQEFYTKWYKENKDKAFLPKKMYDIIDSQKAKQQQLLK
ncbi:extracellular solute-binding protein [Paenibacillus cymbidii]|uniref:extracellular solute-binding protein n=1 Tax=Paenibacillus cymbidii TaxID=1639034 RepID=UPI001436A18D|nr:extracellular solute-binding protein [Paenibacillus cymbidii]